LEKSGSKYILSKPLIDALKGSEMNFPMFPVSAMGDDGEVQLSSSGILFLALNPKDDTSKFIAAKLWHIWIRDFTLPPNDMCEVSTGIDGIFTAPTFTADGKGFAFLATDSLSVAGAFNRIFVIPSFLLDAKPIEIVVVREKKWDLNPESLAWSNDSSELFVQAEERARRKLWKLPLARCGHLNSPLEVTPVLLSEETGSVTSFFHLNNLKECNKLLINTSSMIDSGSFHIKDTSTLSKITFPQFNFNHLEFGLRRSQISEINFKGKREDYDVQAWVFKPSDFDEKKTYPLAFLIHGGPTGNWGDSWSTRWNPAVWAEQGYVVVLPNPYALLL
jgi:hypothetical protein